MVVIYPSGGGDLPNLNTSPRAPVGAKKAGGGVAPAAGAHDASFAPGVSGFVTNQEERTQEVV